MNRIQTATNYESTGNWVDANRNEESDVEIVEVESSAKSGKSSPIFGNLCSKPVLGNSILQPVFGNSATVNLFGSSAAHQNKRLSDEHKPVFRPVFGTFGSGLSPDPRSVFNSNSSDDDVEIIEIEPKHDVVVPVIEIDSNDSNEGYEFNNVEEPVEYKYEPSNNDEVESSKLYSSTSGRMSSPQVNDVANTARNNGRMDPPYLNMILV
uniref:Uncharacterized protein n=1 Tax=Cacopsylla melanoneura TaxID=428564 RepID=A0A8D8WAC0_9HEMI